MSTKCSVCGASAQTNSNSIITCGGCALAVHEGCYGVKREFCHDKWFCRKCESQVRISKIRCDLCPIKDGAFKRCRGARYGWAHILCAVYIDGIYFEDPDNMDLILLCDVSPDRFGRPCVFCERNQRSSQANHGVCIQCATKSCRVYFHVTCASLEGLLSELPWSDADSTTSLARVITRTLPAEQTSLAQIDTTTFGTSTCHRDGVSCPLPTDSTKRFYGFCSLRHKENFLSALSAAHQSSTATPAVSCPTSSNDPLGRIAVGDGASIDFAADNGDVLQKDTQPSFGHLPTSRMVAALGEPTSPLQSGSICATPPVELGTHPNTNVPQPTPIRELSGLTTETNTESVGNEIKQSGENCVELLPNSRSPPTVTLASSAPSDISLDQTQNCNSSVSYSFSNVRTTTTTTSHPTAMDCDLSQSTAEMKRVPEKCTVNAHSGKLRRRKKTAHLNAAKETRFPPQRPLPLRGSMVSFGNTTKPLLCSSKQPQLSSTDCPLDRDGRPAPLLTMEDLLEWQWNQAGNLLMHHVDGTDVVSLLDSLHKLKSENDSLESKLLRLKTRYEHLRSVNLRLSASLSAMESASTAPSNVGNVPSYFPSLTANESSQHNNHVHRPRLSEPSDTDPPVTKFRHDAVWHSLESAPTRPSNSHRDCCPTSNDPQPSPRSTATLVVSRPIVCSSNQSTFMHAVPQHTVLQSPVVSCRMIETSSSLQSPSSKNANAMPQANSDSYSSVYTSKHGSQQHTRRHTTARQRPEDTNREKPRANVQNQQNTYLPNRPIDYLVYEQPARVLFGKSGNSQELQELSARLSSAIAARQPSASVKAGCIPEPRNTSREHEKSGPYRSPEISPRSTNAIHFRPVRTEKTVKSDELNLDFFNLHAVPRDPTPSAAQLVEMTPAETREKTIKPPHLVHSSSPKIALNVSIASTAMTAPRVVQPYSTTIDETSDTTEHGTTYKT
ncbi:unnamed protein product [Dicrocoelium dendriticum]|nr:unnamed protein product [Dicrocoelium dendriticum]